MKIYDVLQWAIVIGVVVLSALYTLGRVAPRWRARFAQHLQQPRYARWINRLGARIGGGAGGCGSCDSCGTCEPPPVSRKH